jgi:hypothetical protein
MKLFKEARQLHPATAAAVAMTRRSAAGTDAAPAGQRENSRRRDASPPEPPRRRDTIMTASLQGTRRISGPGALLAIEVSGIATAARRVDGIRHSLATPPF